MYDAVSARAGCRQELNTTVFQLCKTVPDLDTEPYIDSCAKDAVVRNIFILFLSMRLVHISIELKVILSLVKSTSY